MTAKNQQLMRAKNARDDEFYTLREDVERELEHYTEAFRGKNIYLNADNPETSEFWNYFIDNFHRFGLAKLTSTYYNADGVAKKTTYNGEDVTVEELEGNGDFRNDENIEILKSSDLIISNPPFSEWRSYVAQLFEHDKKFIIMGGMTNLNYLQAFSKIMEGELYLGHTVNKSTWFKRPNNTEKYTKTDSDGNKYSSVNISWYQNIKRFEREPLELSVTYENNEGFYPTYDNYAAINVNRIAQIPGDYYGVMGVPITFIGKYNEQQFDLLGATSAPEGMEYKTVHPDKIQHSTINGRQTFSRLLIKRKKNEVEEKKRTNNEYYEKVNPKHPDKVADRIAGAIVDLAYTKNTDPKVAVEVLIGGGDNCYVIIQTSENISDKEVDRIVKRIAGEEITTHAIIQPQDVHLANNQKENIRAGDNGIFKGLPITETEAKLTKFAKDLYKVYNSDGKHILDANNGGRLIISQSYMDTDEISEEAQAIIDEVGAETVNINQLGYWTGGVNVDVGCTNRKLGSDMAQAVTGGGLHGKDLSKADVTLNIYAHLKAQELGREVLISCGIGDEYIDDKPYYEIVEIAREYINNIGGFEKFAEWGLL